MTPWQTHTHTHLNYYKKQGFSCLCFWYPHSSHSIFIPWRDIFSPSFWSNGMPFSFLTAEGEFPTSILKYVILPWRTDSYWINIMLYQNSGWQQLESNQFHNLYPLFCNPQNCRPSSQLKNLHLCCSPSSPFTNIRLYCSPSSQMRNPCLETHINMLTLFIDELRIIVYLNKM